MRQKIYLLLFVLISAALWVLQMTTDILTDLLPRPFYAGLWGLLLFGFVIWPAVDDVLKEACHETD